MFAAVYKLTFPHDNPRIQDKFFDANLNAVQVEGRDSKEVVTIGIHFPMGVQAILKFCRAWNIGMEKISSNYTEYE